MALYSAFGTRVGKPKSVCYLYFISRYMQPERPWQRWWALPSVTTFCPRPTQPVTAYPHPISLKPQFVRNPPPPNAPAHQFTSPTNSPLPPRPYGCGTDAKGGPFACLGTIIRTSTPQKRLSPVQFGPDQKNRPQHPAQGIEIPQGTTFYIHRASRTANPQSSASCEQNSHAEPHSSTSDSR